MVLGLILVGRERITAKVQFNFNEMFLDLGLAITVQNVTVNWNCITFSETFSPTTLLYFNIGHDVGT